MRNDYISTSAIYNPNESYLSHHGIKGQRWGVRRYQNPDGSLTPAGRARYGTVENYRNAQAYKSAKKEYNRAFNEAYNKRIQIYSPSKKRREAESARWDKAIDKADELNKAKSAYKESKKSAEKEKPRGVRFTKAALKTVGYTALGTASGTMVNLGATALTGNPILGMGLGSFYATSVYGPHIAESGREAYEILVEGKK